MKDKILNKYMKEGSSSIPKGAKKKIKDGLSMLVTKKGGGSLIGKQKNLDVNKDGRITGSDFEILKTNKKKYGGKISYRMTGGQVVDSSYD
jgi:hypothetical protein